MRLQNEDLDVKSTFNIAVIAALALVMSCSPGPQIRGIDSPDPRPPACTFRIAEEYEQSSNIVDCVTYDNGVTTIELVQTRSVRVTLTNNATQVNMIGFGGSGPSGPSLTYPVGNSASGPATVARNGDTFTVSGTAIAAIDDPDRSLVKPFEIVATTKCRRSTSQAPATLTP